MSKYQSMTIKETMNNIAKNNYLLPAIQRKFVWETDQIEMLFDSILRGYPINSFMLWKITSTDIKNNYKFYTFIKDFTKKFNENNPDAPTELLNEFYAVIDGQQRMTSLYIGLIGSYRNKRPNVWWKNTEDAMPTKTLYLDLLAPLESAIDNEKMYGFRFLTSSEAVNNSTQNQGHFWFKVGKILDFNSVSDVTTFVDDNSLSSNKFALDTLLLFFNKVNNEDLINYCVIAEQDQDKVLDIFLRTNSGGTPLSFSDLLMSITSANWTLYDAREQMQKIRDEIYSFGTPPFDVSQDFILKSILALSDSDIKFKITNFGKAKTAKFQEDWSRVYNSLVATFKLLEQLGFNDNILRSKNAAIPVAYYIYKNDLANIIIKPTYDQADKKNISKWLSMSLLKGIFGGHSDNVLTKIRAIISQSTTKKFPINEIVDDFKTNLDKNYTFDTSVIESLLEEQYGSVTAWIILNLIYPDVILNHGKSIAEDHMHPKTQFENNTRLEALNLSDAQKAFYKDRKNYNSVLNLQFLEESINQSKGDMTLKDWVDCNKKTHSDLLVKASTSLDIMNFEQFIQDRREELSSRLQLILSD